LCFLPYSQWHTSFCTLPGRTCTLQPGPPILGIDFLRKLRIAVALENSHIMFACTAMAQTTAKISLPSFFDHAAAGATPPPPTLMVRGSQVDSFQSNSQGNQSIVDPPLSIQSIPDSVPADVKVLHQKFPSLLRTGDVVPNPSHGVEHHIHTGRHSPVFAKACPLDPEKLEIAKVEFKRLESASIVHRSTSPWGSPLHMVPKKIGLHGLVVITVTLI
jgi:hypothetical protein